MSGGPWGNSEMDYILFIKPDGPVTVAANPEEIDDARWVTREELREMMDPASGLRWSPWFRIIAEKFLDTWWAELDKTLGTDTHVDLETIRGDAGGVGRRAGCATSRRALATPRPGFEPACVPSPMTTPLAGGLDQGDIRMTIVQPCLTKHTTL